MTESDTSPETAKDKSKAAAYQVLARKYRPQNFDDLIGHGSMVKTLRNAFASDRIAHAYILTGVRGVGKTTTARILARALNYVGPDGADNGPQIDMPVEGRHCKAIAESRHPDVLEMDAASRTGVGDIRELIEGVRYAPVEARYKVYIIDEVHMLSTAAFNALLKTLEEPPAHVKFIFATTEIRKLPVTVLSRCQRFDLRRIEPEILTDHLGSIAERENVTIDRDGLWMIARAAEGSVRDGLSILDQAIVQHTAQKSEDIVSAEMIRDMLGLADRGSVWALLDACFKGDTKTALENFRAQYDAGAEPTAILRDLLDLTHLLTRIKAAGPAAAAHGPAGEADAERAKTMADALEMNALTRAWSLLMKGLGETQIAPDAAASAEMGLIRLAFAADLPTPDEALRALKKNSLSGAAGAPGPTGGAGDAPQAVQKSAQVYDLHPTRTPKIVVPQVRTFKDVIQLAREKRDAVLRVELESYVHIVSFAAGRIELRLHDDSPPDLANRLALRLKEWTKSQWVISVTNEAQGEETVRGAREREVMEHPMVMHAMELFPGAEVTSIRDVEAAIAPVPDDDEDMPVDPDDDEVAAAMSANAGKQRQETGKA